MRYKKIIRCYSDYYDIKGKRIYDEAMVIYYGKKYLIRVGKAQDKKNASWRLVPTHGGYFEEEGISLEEAVKDKEGGLIIIGYGYGYGYGE